MTVFLPPHRHLQLLVIPGKNPASHDRDFDDNEYRNFELPRQPLEEQEDIQELRKRTMNHHTEDPIIKTPRKDASGCNGCFSLKHW